MIEKLVCYDLFDYLASAKSVNLLIIKYSESYKFVILIAVGQLYYKSQNE